MSYFAIGFEHAKSGRIWFAFLQKFSIQQKQLGAQKSRKAGFIVDQSDWKITARYWETENIKAEFVNSDCIER